MDLIGVLETRVATARHDLVFSRGERPLGGGTWLFSERQEAELTGLVDLTGMGWEPIVETDAALIVSATCTVARLAALTPASLRTDPLDGGRNAGTNDAYALFWQCANSLLASFKIWNVATVGGNIALSLPAGPMTSLAVALDARIVLWSATTERRVPAAAFATGVRTNVLRPGEVLRAIEFPRAALRSRSAFRRIALSPLGRTGTLVTALAGDGVVFTVTGGTSKPELLRFDRMPSQEALAEGIGAIDTWYDDPHGAPDWRRAMSLLLAEELREELA
jgi:CO/xanthine dehydrogenase FAD-binding subunit